MKAYTPTALTPVEPQSYAEALSRPDHKEWEKAIKLEYDSLIENGTWELAKLPPGRKMISCKWVFKLKVKADGTFDRYKARLVARRFSQVPGVDYLETFAPVVKLPTLRALCAISTYKDYELQMFDVKTTFLNGKLDTEIYMQQPPSFIVKGKEDYVCKLIKTLYSLKQSAMAWNAELDAELLALGFTKSQADGSLYIYKKGDSLLSGSLC